MTAPNSIFFVNKSAKSKLLSRSEGLERKRIFSHVQQLPAEAPIQAQELDWSITTTQDYPRNGKIVTTRTNVDHARVQRRQYAARPASDIDPEVILSRHIAQILSIQSPSANPPNAYSLDPFGCGAVPLNNEMADMLKTYCQIVSTHLFTSKPWAQNYLHHHLASSTDRPELLYAMLYATASEIHAGASSQQNVYRTIYLKGQALHHLHRNIEGASGTQQPGVATMRAITFLLYIECVQDDLEAARYHYKALQNILDTLDDVDKIPLAVRTGVLIPSVFCAAILAERPLCIPIFEGQEDEEGTKRFATELLSHQDLEVFTRGRPSRLSTPENKILIGRRLSSVIAKTNELERWKQTCLSTKREHSSDEVRLLFGQRLAIAQQLSAVTEQPDPFTAEQHAVRLALFLCYTPVRAAFDVANVFNRCMATQTRSALERTDLASMWAPCSEILLWVLTVTFSVFHDEVGITWMARTAAKVKEHLGIATWDELESSLMGYVYPQRQFGSSAKRLWHMIQAYRVEE